ncbi:whirlin-like [Dysidea avara]|uniref:whirlin-like n=1 Tax=Dysidea avara TaxID=196820 RepID=UPI00332C4599
MITITIHKVTKRLGIAVNGGADTRQVAVRIKEIIPGGSAAKTGQGLRVEQQILQINTTSLKGLKHKEAVAIIKSAFDSPEKTMTIIVVDPEEEEEEDY